jgi:hypothetical protein
MKTCPVCNARCFDDMNICYGCLYRFDLRNANSAVVPAVAEEVNPDEPTVPFPAVSGDDHPCAGDRCRSTQVCDEAPDGLGPVASGVEDSVATRADAVLTDSDSTVYVSAGETRTPLTLNIPCGSSGRLPDGEGYRLVLDVRFEPLPSRTGAFSTSGQQSSGHRRTRNAAGMGPRRCNSEPSSTNEGPESAAEALADANKQNEKKPCRHRAPEAKASAETAPAQPIAAGGSSGSAGKKRRRRRSRKAAAPVA